MKTNAARILEEQGVRFELREYAFDPADLSATKVADAIRMPAEQVFKTLLVRGERGGPCFAVIPANCELDLKALARLAGDRRMEMVPLKDVQPLTGYIRGGVTVLGAKKAFPVFVDETATLFDAIAVSAGVRGTQIVMAGEDYIRVTGASIGEIGIAG